LSAVKTEKMKACVLWGGRIEASRVPSTHGRVAPSVLLAELRLWLQRSKKKMEATKAKGEKNLDK